MTTQKERLLELADKVGVLRPRDLKAHGIHRSALQRLVNDGLVRRIGRGLYETVDADVTEHIDLVEACKRVPHGVICLISALVFHDLTTQMPYEVWMAIDVKSHKPNLERPPVRFVRFSGAALTFGNEVHEIQGATIRITSAAKTVADCFKYRNKIGIDVATEALKEFRRTHRQEMDALWEAATVCRVQNIIRSYIEALQ
jgi:predicted transcriptional regulator of viral defense system